MSDDISLSFDIEQRPDGWWIRLAEDDAEWQGPYPTESDAGLAAHKLIGDLYREIVREMFS